MPKIKPNEYSVSRRQPMAAVLSDEDAPWEGLVDTLLDLMTGRETNQTSRQQEQDR